MQPRDFLIEEYLEKNRFWAYCNLGESGIRNLNVGELLNTLKLTPDAFLNLSLADSPNRGRESLRREIASLYGGKVTEENILVTTGTSEALYLFFFLVLSRGSRVRLFTPAFQALYEIPRLLGAEILGYDLTENPLSMEDFLSPPCDLYILNHPHNPTGIGLREKDWAVLEEYVRGSDSIFLFDEHYRFLDFTNDLTRSGVHLGNNCYATGSITKCFGVVGLKIGWIVGEKDLLDRMRSFKDYTTHTVNPFSEFLCEKILKARKQLIEPIRKSVLENIYEFLDKSSQISSILEFRPPDGGLVSFPKLQVGIPSEEYVQSLMQETSVFLLPGKSFEKEGFVRIGFGEERIRFSSGIQRWIEWDRKKYRGKM